jgi:hypothetical protein
VDGFLPVLLGEIVRVVWGSCGVGDVYVLSQQIQNQPSRRHLHQLYMHSPKSSSAARINNFNSIG